MILDPQGEVEHELERSRAPLSELSLQSGSLMSSRKWKEIMYIRQQIKWATFHCHLLVKIFHLAQQYDPEVDLLLWTKRFAGM